MSTDKRAARQTSSVTNDIQTAAQAREKLHSRGWTDEQLERATAALSRQMALGADVERLVRTASKFASLAKAMGRLKVPAFDAPRLSVDEPSGQSHWLPDIYRDLRVALTNAQSKTAVFAGFNRVLKGRDARLDAALFAEHAPTIAAAEGHAAISDLETALLALLCGLKGAPVGTHEEMGRAWGRRRKKHKVWMNANAPLLARIARPDGQEPSREALSVIV